MKNKIEQFCYSMSPEFLEVVQCFLSGLELDSELCDESGLVDIDKLEDYMTVEQQWFYPYNQLTNCVNLVSDLIRSDYKKFFEIMYELTGDGLTLDNMDSVPNYIVAYYGHFLISAMKGLNLEETKAMIHGIIHFNED